MSVHRLACPDCGYELVYALLGSKGSYRTDGTFALRCVRATEIQTHDAMNCPVLRAAAEGVIRARLPGSDAAREE